MDKITVKNLDLYYGDFKALKTVNMNIAPQRGDRLHRPSGCGKSTLLKSLNRMNDLVEGCKSPAKSFWTGRTSTATSTSTSCASGWAWCSRSPTPSP